MDDEWGNHPTVPLNNGQRHSEPDRLAPQICVRNLFNSHQETHNWRGLGC